MAKEKMTLENAFAVIIGDFLRGRLNVAMPAIVTAYDDANRVTVQPVIKRKYQGQDSKPLPPIEDVPVMFPGAGDYWLTFPIEIGSWVMLVCSQRSIDAWKNSADGGVVDATTPRRFSFSDAVAIPGLLPFAESMAVGSGIQLRNKDGDVKIAIDGDDITLTNSNGTVALSASGGVDINGHLTVEPA